MGKIAADTLNSVYDSQIAKRYLNSLKSYPLKLNVALPVYSWAVHIRDQKAIGLRNKMEIPALLADPDFKHFGQRFIRAANSHYNNGIFYRKGDLLKFEKITAGDLEEMAESLKANLKSPPAEIIFYDLDELNTKTYEKGFFEAIANRF